MSTTTVNANTASQINPEQAVAFAALILADDNLAITPEKTQALLKAAGIEDVEPIWTTLFANALKGKDIKGILTAVTTSSPKGGPGGPEPQDQRGNELEHTDEFQNDINEDTDSDDAFCTMFD